jgi:hypothetical protein
VILKFSGLGSTWLRSRLAARDKGEVILGQFVGAGFGIAEVVLLMVISIQAI